MQHEHRHRTAACRPNEERAPRATASHRVPPAAAELSATSSQRSARTSPVASTLTRTSLRQLRRCLPAPNSAARRWIHLLCERPQHTRAGCGHILACYACRIKDVREIDEQRLSWWDSQRYCASTSTLDVIQRSATFTHYSILKSDI